MLCGILYSITVEWFRGFSYADFGVKFTGECVLVKISEKIYGHHYRFSFIQSIFVIMHFNFSYSYAYLLVVVEILRMAEM
jgi:hypothetical protein